MTKREFLGIAGGSIFVVASGGYLLSDKHNASRIKQNKAFGA